MQDICVIFKFYPYIHVSTKYSMYCDEIHDVCF